MNAVRLQFATWIPACRSAPAIGTVMLTAGVRLGRAEDRKRSMTVPTTYPCWVVLPDGRSAMVLDQNGYNAAVAAGAVHNTTTPSKATRTGSAMTTIQDLALSLDENDGRPLAAQGGRGGKLR
jgi:hypothetical protein